MKNSGVLIGCLVVVVTKILNTGATVTLLNSEGFVFATVKVSVVVWSECRCKLHCLTSRKTTTITPFSSKSRGTR